MLRFSNKLFSLARTSLHHLTRKPHIHRSPCISRFRCDDVSEDKFYLEYLEDVEEDKINEEYNMLSKEYLGHIAGGHRVLLIQPYIKWGPTKKTITTPELQISEAESLVNSLPYWEVIESVRAPMLNMRRRYLFGTGTLKNMKMKIQSLPGCTAVFVSINFLLRSQAKELQNEFGIPVFDRYSIIIHIFREHAKSPEAKLQVALAEVPYIYQQTCALEDGKRDDYPVLQQRKKVLFARRAKLISKVKKLKEHRMLIRSNRSTGNFPTVAVVGYTNAGKTSLIKALTGDKRLEPKNQLFATLDTTTHLGILPCKVELLFIDTIGFIQDVPEKLIEPFVVTLEDALIADIIIHIYDASHPDIVAQIDHVNNTLKSLLKEDRPVITVANKCDVQGLKHVVDGAICVSAVHSTGIDVLRLRVQELILSATGRAVVKVRVKAGSPQEAYLYSQTSVLNASTDSANPQFMLLEILVTDEQFFQFKRFLRQSASGAM